MIAPNTDVYLLKCPLTKDQKNQLDFATESAQATYFSSLPKYILSANDYTYQRKDNIIRASAEYDSIDTYNYVMYRNTTYDTKWYYAFIDRMEYINPNCTNIYIKTDSWQTWFFEMKAGLKDSYVSREHVAKIDDVAYKYTLPEPTPSIEYTNDLTTAHNEFAGKEPLQFATNYWCGVYAVPPDYAPTDATRIVPQTPTQQYIGGTPSNGYLYLTANADRMDYLIDRLIEKKYKIVFTVAVPKAAVNPIPAISDNGVLAGVWVGQDLTEISLSDTAFTASIDVRSMGTHTIRNQKLNCYPYRFRKLTDLNGQSVILKNELIDNNDVIQHITSGASPSVLVYPKKYNGITSDFANSITIYGFPPLPYDTSAYSEYIALHKNTIEVANKEQAFDNTVKTVTALGDITTSIATGNVGLGIRGVQSFGDAIFSDLKREAMFEDLKQAPPKVHNTPKANTLINNNAIGWAVYDTHLTDDYAELIDRYFDVFGYNVSTVKAVQFNSRSNWNYVQTVGINIVADIPQDDLQEIKDIFDRGVTVWHNPSTYCDYSQTNS